MTRKPISFWLAIFVGVLTAHILNEVIGGFFGYDIGIFNVFGQYLGEHLRQYIHG